MNPIGVGDVLSRLRSREGEQVLDSMYARIEPHLSPAQHEGKLTPVMVGHATTEDALPHASLLVSCVGKRTLDFRDPDLLPDGAIWVNAASADDELDPQEPLLKPGSVVDADGAAWATFRDLEQVLAARLRTN